MRVVLANFLQFVSSRHWVLWLCIIRLSNVIESTEISLKGRVERSGGVFWLWCWTWPSAVHGGQCCLTSGQVLCGNSRCGCWRKGAKPMLREYLLQARHSAVVFAVFGRHLWCGNGSSERSGTFLGHLTKMWQSWTLFSLKSPAGTRMLAQLAYRSRLLE